jgi:hypothetical protein
MRKSKKERRRPDNLMSDTGRIVQAIGRVIEGIPRKAQNAGNACHSDARTPFDHLRPPIGDMPGGYPTEQEHARDSDPTVDAQNDGPPRMLDGPKFRWLRKEIMENQPVAAAEPQGTEGHHDG